MVTLTDARSILGASATQSSSCSADDCNYLTDGGIGALTIAVSTGASQQDFANSSGAVTPVTASALQQVASTANGRIQ